MRSVRGVGLGLSIVFGCLFLALMAELYYLLWWKRRITSSRGFQDSYSSPAREFLYMFCLKKSSYLRSSSLNPEIQVHEPQPHRNNELWIKTFGEDESVETDLLRIQHLSGPPRFLFTIKEETKEDLESEDNNKSRKTSRGRSLSDVILTVETPFFTPLASPPFFTPPLTPMDYKFNTLFQSTSGAEFNKIRSSPPPKLKFLRDAEDKLQRRRLMENYGYAKDEGLISDFLREEENGSFISLISAKHVDRESDGFNNGTQHHPSSSSQVLPLTASPPSFRPQSNENPISRALLYLSNSNKSLEATN